MARLTIALRIVLFLATLATAACVDASTAPVTSPVEGRAVRDTTVIDGDSTQCRSGFVIINGRVVCDV